MKTTLVFDRAVFIICVLSMKVLYIGCDTVNPLCGENYCVEGKIYPKSELGTGANYDELRIDDATVFKMLEQTLSADNSNKTEGGTTDILRPTTNPLPTVTPAPLPVIIPPVVEETVVKEPTVSFKDDLIPILREKCAFAGCHFAVKGRHPAGGLDLYKYDGLIKGGKSGPIFFPGNGKGSLLRSRISRLGGMPPEGVRRRLRENQIQLFIDWIDEGALNN